MEDFEAVMTLRIEESARSFTVRVAGPVEPASTPRLRRALDAAALSDVSQVTIDATRARPLSAFAAGLIAAAELRLTSQGKRVEVLVPRLLAG